MEIRNSHLVVSWNAAGIIQHYPEMLHFLDSLDHSPMAICLQESHLFCKDIPTIAGFSYYDNPRLDSLGGGTTIYVNNDYLFSCIPTFSNPVNPTIEGNSIKIQMSSIEVIITNLYLPPNKPISKEILKNITIHENHLLVGDFKAKSTQWGSPKGDKRGGIVQAFIESNNLVCLNDGSGTHLKYDGDISHLDLALRRVSISLLSDFNVLSDSWGSDHYPLLLNLFDKNCPTVLKRQGYNFRKTDWSKYREEFDRLLEANIIANNNSSITYSADSMYDSLLEYIENSKIISTPKTIQKKEKKYSPFWNEDCRNAISSRRKAEKHMKKHKANKELHIEFNKCKANVKKVIKCAKQTYWLKVTEYLKRDSNLSCIWRLVKSINGKINNNNINPYKSLISKQILNIADLVNSFAETFSKISK